jgi:hypothetical protein
LDPLLTEFAFEALVNIAKPLDLGQTALGRRRAIPITGGTFKGPRIEGDVAPGGYDWQTIRADGVTVLEAIYALKVSDGTVIAVRNLGGRTFHSLCADHPQLRRAARATRLAEPPRLRRHDRGRQPRAHAGAHCGLPGQLRPAY